MSPQQALNMLYQAIRQMNAPAEAHEKLKEAVIIIENALMPRTGIGSTNETKPAEQADCATDPT